MPAWFLAPMKPRSDVKPDSDVRPNSDVKSDHAVALGRFRDARARPGRRELALLDEVLRTKTHARLLSFFRGCESHIKYAQLHQMAKFYSTADFANL